MPCRSNSLDTKIGMREGEKRRNRTVVHWSGLSGSRSSRTSGVLGFKWWQAEINTDKNARTNIAGEKHNSLLNKDGNIELAVKVTFHSDNQVHGGHGGQRLHHDTPYNEDHHSQSSDYYSSASASGNSVQLVLARGKPRWQARHQRKIWRRNELEFCEEYRSFALSHRLNVLSGFPMMTLMSCRRSRREIRQSNRPDSLLQNDEEQDLHSSTKNYVRGLSCLWKICHLEWVCWDLLDNWKRQFITTRPSGVFCIPFQDRSIFWSYKVYSSSPPKVGRCWTISSFNLRRILVLGELLEGKQAIKSARSSISGCQIRGAKLRLNVL